MVSQGQNSRFSLVFSSSVCYRHCFCTETSFVFTQQLALWRVQVRHSASWKARSLLVSLPENASACKSPPDRFGVSSPHLFQHAGVCALQAVIVSRKHLALQFSYKSILGGNKISCWLPCHGTPPPLGCRIFRGEPLAPNRTLLVLSQSVVRVPLLVLQRETRSL